MIDVRVFRRRSLSVLAKTRIFGEQLIGIFALYRSAPRRVSHHGTLAPLLLIPILWRLPPALFSLDHRTTRHAHVGELAGHERLHHLHLAHHPHAADGAHHVAAHLELLHELADLVELDAGA